MASGSLRLTSSAARPMQGAVSRLQGSPTSDAAGSSGSCSRIGGDEPLVGDDQRLLGRHEVAEAVDRLAQHRLLAHQGEQLLGRGGAAGRPESRAGAAGHDDCVEHGRIVCGSVAVVRSWRADGRSAEPLIILAERGADSTRSKRRAQSQQFAARRRAGR